MLAAPDNAVMFGRSGLNGMAISWELLLRPSTHNAVLFGRSGLNGIAISWVLLLRPYEGSTFSLLYLAPVVKYPGVVEIPGLSHQGSTTPRWVVTTSSSG
ncbi:MAG: hypothetical protein ACYCZF_03405 [Anaerolineae bacterium]